MTLAELMQALAQRLGSHHWPVDPAASDMARVVDASAIHPEITLRLTRAIAKANHCQKPSDRILRETTLSAIAPIRLDILQAAHTDLDAARFIEACCEAIERETRAAPEEGLLHEDVTRASVTVPARTPVAPVVELRGRLHRRARSP